MESSYKAQIDVQKATLESLHEGVAVFGPDGRLKLHNTEFARLCGMTEIAGEPHLKTIAETCAARFPGDQPWEVISSAINSTIPENGNFLHEIERFDGRVLALSIARLPDRGTLVSFVDVTDQTRLETALREQETKSCASF
jgi:PAS domain-containing protein